MGNFKASFLNYYPSNTNADSPTFFMLSGAFPQALTPSNTYKVALFFDASVNLAFVDSNGDYSCTIGNVYCHPYASSALAISNISGSTLNYHNNLIVFDTVNIADENF
jgi:hypothetical protein